MTNSAIDVFEDLPSKAQKEHLSKLSDYLRSSLKAEFCATLIGVRPFEESSETKFIKLLDYGDTNCGTKGCALGHGPYAGFPKLDQECWLDYALRVFCPGCAFNYLFDAVWFEPTTKPEALADNIDEYLQSVEEIESGKY